jgi:predicted nucleic acid-binding protein
MFKTDQSSIYSLKYFKKYPGDDKFIECAVALGADVIITGDKAVRALGEYKGIDILTPHHLLKA